MRQLVVSSWALGCVFAIAACGDDGPPGGGTDTDPGPDDLTQRGSCEDAPGAGTDHMGLVSQAETWTAAGSPHRVTSDLAIKATVTIEPCAVVLLGSSVHVTVGSATEPGSIIGHGTSQLVGGVLDVRPVTFDALTPAAKWAQIIIEPKGTLDLDVAAIQNGGQPTINEPGMLVVRGVAGGPNDGVVTRSAKLTRVLLESSASYGVNLDGWGGFDAASRKVWIRSSGGAASPYPIRLEAGVVETLPTDLVVTGNMKDEIQLRSSKAHMRDDTFADHGVPYHVTGSLYVNASADGAPVKLTIAAGVTLAFEDLASGITIGSSMTRQGILEAIGTAAAPIVFTSAKTSKAAGDWRNLAFRASPTTGNRVSYARVEYAGADSQTNSFGCGPADNDGAVWIQGTGGDQGAPSAAFIDQTTFDHIAGTTVIVSGWIDDAGPNFSPTNTFGAATPSCKVSRPRRTGAGDVCDGGRTTCWP